MQAGITRGCIINKQRVLVIKLTSMGDLMHALPALTDACREIPGIEFDWVVDEAFAEVPTWHPAVKNIYKSAHRRWRKNFWSALKGGEFSRFYHDINKHDYDVVIDAQDNVKSAFISFLRRGAVHGMDKKSVAEQPAHLAYKFGHPVDRSLHAITRQRLLFASALGYALPASAPDFGLRPDAFRLPGITLPEPYIFLVHNASWTTKLWPENYWHEIIKMAGKAGYQVVLPGGSQEELERAVRMAENHDNALALPRMTLSELGGILAKAAGVICCDTGLAHLSAMIGAPTVCMYGPTSATLIGTTGLNQHHLIAGAPAFSCAPCYKRYCDFDGSRTPMSACMSSFNADMVWRQLEDAMEGATGIVVSSS